MMKVKNIAIGVSVIISLNIACLSHSYGEPLKVETAQPAVLPDSIHTKNVLKPQIDYDGQYHHITLTLPNTQVIPQTGNQANNLGKESLVLEFGQFLNLDCNKHSLLGHVIKSTDKDSGITLYLIDKVHRGPSTMMACFDQALTRQFLAIPETIKLSLSIPRMVTIAVPKGTLMRYRIVNGNDEFIYIPKYAGKD